MKPSGAAPDPNAPPTVVRLDGSGAPAALVGGKGAALDRLIGWGIHVPATAVITAEAFRRVTANPALGDLLRRIEQGDAISGDAVDAAFLAVGMPTDLRTRVATAGRELGGRALAVRSSATVEDLEQSSFAGQYRSLLDVDPTSDTDIVRAVLLVFASLLHPAPRAYREALGVGSRDIAMAAVMMPMIEARRAGVVFTLDPMEMRPTVRVEVVEGQGESLVSGRRTPVVVQLRRVPSATRAMTTGPVPAAQQPGEIAQQVGEIEGGGALGEWGDLVDVALDIERRAGTPQDIEWAWDGEELWIVQARPVTARRSDDGDPIDDDLHGLVDAELTTEGIGEMLPGLLAPLVWQVSSFVVEEGFRIMLDRLGADVSTGARPHWLIRRVRGRAALDVGRLTEMMSAIPGAERRLRQAYGIDEVAEAAAAARPRRRHLARHARRAATARRRASFDAEVMAHAVSEMEAIGFDPTEHTTTELLARHAALSSLAVRTMAAELTVSADAGAIHDAVRDLIARHLPVADAQGWADRVTVPDHVMAPSLRSSAAVIAGPTWIELGLEPSDRVAAIDRTELVDELLEVLATAPRWPAPGLRRRLSRRRLEHLVERAALQFGRRERSKASILSIGGDLRRIHLELGARLVGAHRLGTPEDIDLLTLEEVRALLDTADGAGAAVRPPTELGLDRRRRVLEGHLAGPALPARWRGRPASPVVAERSQRCLTGWAVSGGRFVGRARRVDGPHEVIGRDEVLVAEATDPSWTPVLLRCGALVIERGGPLSHAAILAREFGLPAVFNVAGAAALLDGRQVRVDGDAGTVEILDDVDTDREQYGNTPVGADAAAVLVDDPTATADESTVSS